jgi:hypothetical protein
MKKKKPHTSDNKNPYAGCLPDITIMSGARATHTRYSWLKLGKAKSSKIAERKAAERGIKKAKIFFFNERVTFRSLSHLSFSQILTL